MHVSRLWQASVCHMTEDIRRLLMSVCGNTKCWPPKVVLRGKPLFLVPWRMWVAGRPGIFRRVQVSSVSWYPAARRLIRGPSARRHPRDRRRRRRHFAAALQKQHALCCFWKNGRVSIDSHDLAAWHLIRATKLQLYAECWHRDWASWLPVLELIYSCSNKFLLLTVKLYAQ